MLSMNFISNSEVGTRICYERGPWFSDGWEPLNLLIVQIKKWRPRHVKAGQTQSQIT